MYRLWMFLGFLCAAGAMGFAFYLQFSQGLEPCPLCIFQRVALLVGAVPLLIAAIHGPRGGGRWVYTALATLGFGSGAAIAGRHVWLQSLPPDQVPACGPSLDYMIDIMPLGDVVSTVLRGDGNCAIIDWSFLGYSLPAWTLAGFGALLIWTLVSRRIP